MAYCVLATTSVFAVLYAGYQFHTLEGVELTWFAIGLLGFKTAVEIVASTYGFATMFTAIAYLFWKETQRETVASSQCPPVGIVYLCCEDLDEAALASLTKLKYRGKLYLVIHDDSKSLSAQAQVNALVEQLRKRSQCDCVVLRRKQRIGGKSGALNYVLEQTGHLYDYFLLCDNDSTAFDPLSIEKALPYFEDKQLAVVQCRTVAVDSPDYSPVNRLLSRSIDAFHVFFTVQSRFGWQPFIGHNAFLRSSAVREVGGFTPGFFADDLDLTVRLNLKGYRVAYAPEITVGEKHPPSYTSFRKRSYKWAYGCMQVLKAHARSVLSSPRFSLPEKLSFFQFAGFYVGQTVLLLYLALTFLIGPLFLEVYPISLRASLISGSVIIFLIYLPTLVYFAKERKFAGCPGTVIACGLVYGATDFLCARGVWDCLWNRDKEWIPTNSQCHERGDLALLVEALFGALLLCVPAFAFPALLYLPCSFFFGAKFLFGPAMSLLYDDRREWMKPFTIFKLPRSATALMIFVVLALYVLAPSHANDSSAESARVEIRGKDIYVDGQKFLVKGVSYGPWRPGTGPNKGYPYPGPKEIEEDLSLIHKH